MAYLVDTNIVGELMKKAPDAKVLRWFKKTGDELGISAVSLEEVYFGLSWRPAPAKLQFFEAIASGFKHRYNITPAIAQRAGRLRGQLKAEGISRSPPDMLIAATAIEHQLAIVTRNTRDFLGCGVQVINPFD